MKAHPIGTFSHSSRRLCNVSMLAVGVLVLQFGLGAPAFARAGALDATFGTHGKVGLGSSRFGNAEAVALQADGKIVVAGSVDARFTVARFATDGRLDRTFGEDGIVSALPPHIGRATAVFVQSDGKIVAIGSAPGAPFALVRFNTDGTLDRSFGGDGRVRTSFGDPASCYSRAIVGALGRNGKIVAAGVAECAGPERFAVARYLTNGALDKTFSNNGKVQTSVQLGIFEQNVAGVAVLPDGKTIVGGAAAYYRPPGAERWSDFALVRFNVNGTLDGTFGGDGKVTTKFQEPRCDGPGEAHALTIQPDGKIVLAGIAACGGHAVTALVRYHRNGTLDPTFGVRGRAVTFGQGGYYPIGLAIQSDGKLVEVGTNGRFVVERYRPKGHLDTTFGNGGMVQTVFGTGPGSKEGYASAVVIQTDRKIVVVGYAARAGFGFAMARYLAS